MRVGVVWFDGFSDGVGRSCARVIDHDVLRQQDAFNMHNRKIFKEYVQPISYP